MIEIKQNEYKQILKHCVDGLPNEACGLLAGTINGEDKTVLKVYGLTNPDASREHFSMDPKEQLLAFKDARANGMVILGNFHSHPESPSRPSEEDKRLAYDSSMEYLILSLKNREHPVLRAFEIAADKTVTASPIVLKLRTDALIIGGGTAGCYAALTLSRYSGLSVLVAEKANIKRSGCLAAGVNAVNAYITKGRTPRDYADYAMKDGAGIAREDLLLSAAGLFNEVTSDMEKLGLVILKDANGDYVTRGDRNIKINGENFKPLLAEAVRKASGVTVRDHLNITDLLTRDGKVLGAVGFSVTDETRYVISAKTVLVATGGAAGLYRPNNPGFSRHKMWYPPFNTGAGYAMGLRSGAEMTTFESRFIALRCKDTIAPTGTIAQGVRAKQVNAKGEVYETRYERTTSGRVYGTVREKQLGNGPCYLKTTGIGEEKAGELLKAYLNMVPGQTLKWVESGEGPNERDVEIEGTEPYIVGGHTASGYWVGVNRETTVTGLYAAGDVAGGCPQKYVTGALAEGKLAALDMIRRIQSAPEENDSDPETLARPILDEYAGFLTRKRTLYSIEELEEAMQKIMDEYAGGISRDYQYNGRQLDIARKKISELTELAEGIYAADNRQLLSAYELKERLLVCQAVIAHLRGRKETRWRSFNENQDFPDRNPAYDNKFLNSRLENGEIRVFWREKETGNEYSD